MLSVHLTLYKATKGIPKQDDKTPKDVQAYIEALLNCREAC
jgi:hypothetical protein